MANFAVPIAGLLFGSAYFLYPRLCRQSATEEEATRPLPGDEIVPTAQTGYTLAITIAAPPEQVWPWLVQMGQGRGGFYTHAWVENLLGADFQNAEQIVADWQTIKVGDTIRLTPDPYHGFPGQNLTVAEIDPARALVYRQVMPSGVLGSWAFILEPRGEALTRLIFRRRAGPPSLFDRIALPGYYFMDMGMLAGIKQRAVMSVVS